jgi:hypothetical protein
VSKGVLAPQRISNPPLKLKTTPVKTAFATSSVVSNARRARDENYFTV